MYLNFKLQVLRLTIRFERNTEKHIPNIELRVFQKLCNFDPFSQSYICLQDYKCGK